jgi:hypothetical protein
MAVSVLVVAIVMALVVFFRTRGDRLRWIRSVICTLAHTVEYIAAPH